jgi:hypothetical protein
MGEAGALSREPPKPERHACQKRKRCVAFDVAASQFMKQSPHVEKNIDCHQFRCLFRFLPLYFFCLRCVSK